MEREKHHHHHQESIRKIEEIKKYLSGGDGDDSFPNRKTGDVRNVRSIFKEIVGVESVDSRDEDHIYHYIENHSFGLYEFRKVIENEIKNSYYKEKPHLISIAHFFNPKREPAVLMIINRDKVLRSVERSEGIRINGYVEKEALKRKIKLQCGCLFEQVYDKIYTGYKKKDAKDTKPEFRWKWANEKDLYNHDCQNLYA